MSDPTATTACGNTRMSRPRGHSVALICCLLAVLTAPVAAAAPQGLGYGGRLTLANGSPVAGPVDLEFQFYTQASGGTGVLATPLLVPGVSLIDGIFNVDLPLSVSDLQLLLGDGASALFIEIQDVTRAVVYPRQRFLAAPFALRVPVDNQSVVFDADGKLTIGTLAELKLEAAPGNDVVLRASPGSNSNLILTLPGTPGTSGQVLTTDGAGGMAWGNVSGGGNACASGSYPNGDGTCQTAATIVSDGNGVKTSDTGTVTATMLAGAIPQSKIQSLTGDLAALTTAIGGKADSAHTHGAATTSAAGFMSSADKTKLDGIPAGAGVVDATSVANATAIMDADFSAVGLMKRTGSGTYTSITDNSANWNTAYTERLQWDGSAVGNAAAQLAGRGNLGLGDMATQNGSAVSITGGAISGATLSAIPSFGLREGGASPTHQTIFQAGDQTASITYTLPTAAPGTSGYVLSATTAGVMSWVSPTTGSVTSVGVTAPAAGITSSGGPVTSSGSITLALANDLAAVEGLAGTGGVERTGTDTWATYTLSAAGKALIDDADATAQRTTLGLAALATAAAVSGGTGGTITDASITDADVSATANITASKLGTGVVDNTEFNYLNGVTSAIQTQLNSKGSGTVTSVGVTAPAAGITSSGGPVTSSGSVTLALANDLAGVEGLTGTGGVERTGTDTWATYTLSAAGKALIDDADATAQRTTLGLAALATAAAVSGGTGGTITDASITDADVSATANITASKLGTGVVDNTEFNYLNGVTSAIQTQLNAKGAGTVTSVGVTAPAAGITSSGGPVTSSGSVTLALANDLAAVEGLSGTGGVERTGTDTWGTYTLSAAGKALIDDADATAQRTTLGLAIGTNVQAYDAGLQSIAGLTTVADRMIYTTASDTYAVTPLTAAGRSLIDDADASAQRTTLGLAALATAAAVSGGTGGTITDASITDADVSASANITATKLGTGVVDNTEFNYLNGVTSAIQTQLNAKGAGTVTSVGVTAPAAGITSSGGPVTSSGSVTLALANDLAAVEGLSGTGGVERTGTDTWATYTLSTAGKALIDDADAAAQRTTLGLAALATATAVSGGTGGTITDATVTDADISATANITATKLGTGAVDNTEFNYLNGVTSAVQTQLDAKLPLTGGTLTGPLAVTGAVKIGASSTTCDAAAAGSLRYDAATTVIEHCDGASWKPVNGGPVKLATVTASASSAVTFTGLTSTYSSYIVKMHNVRPSSDDSALLATVSTNNGSSWRDSLGDYDWAAYIASGSYNNPYTFYGSATIPMTRVFAANNMVGNGTAEGAAAEFELRNPMGTSQTARHLFWTTSYVAANGNYYYVNGTGQANTTTAINALRFTFDSGNISTGTFILYGVP